MLLCWSLPWTLVRQPGHTTDMSMPVQPVYPQQGYPQQGNPQQGGYPAAGQPIGNQPMPQPIPYPNGGGAFQGPPPGHPQHGGQWAPPPQGAVHTPGGVPMGPQYLFPPAYNTLIETGGQGGYPPIQADNMGYPPPKVCRCSCFINDQLWHICLAFASHSPPSSAAPSAMRGSRCAKAGVPNSLF
jgi:hypothetical protein